MRDINIWYWLAFLVFKLVVLWLAIDFDILWPLLISLAFSIPFYLYLFKVIGPKENS